MGLLLQQIFNGLMLGSTYAIVALGLTLVYGILHVPNFAHGHLYMLGAYICFFLITVYSFGYWPAVIVATLALGAIGVIVERLAYRPLTDQPHINSFISAGTTRAVYGEDVIVSPGMMTGNTDTRYYWDITKHIFRYGPGFDPTWDKGLGNVHTVDEKISVVNHINMVKWFTLFVRNMDEADLE